MGGHPALLQSSLLDQQRILEHLIEAKIF